MALIKALLSRFAIPFPLLMPPSFWLLDVSSSANELLRFYISIFRDSFDFI